MLPRRMPSRRALSLPSSPAGWTEMTIAPMPFYKVGAFGRVACLTGVAGLVALAGHRPGTSAIAAFFVLWTAYAFVSGIVAVAYNDIVARLIRPERRSRNRIQA